VTDQIIFLTREVFIFATQLPMDCIVSVSTAMENRYVAMLLK
jgi:hypothetical protein